MAVDTVLLKHDMSGDISLDDRYRASGTKSRTWTVTVTDPANDTETTVEASSLVVKVGSAHPDSVYYRCKKVTTRRVSPLLFEVTATYETPDYDPGTSGTGTPNPLLVPALITYGTYSSDELIDEDINGGGIQTVNGELFQGVSRQVSDLQITIQKNFSSFTPAAFYTYIDSVNSDSFLGFPPGVLRVSGIEASEVVQDDWRYWSVSVTLLARKPYRVPNAQAWWIRIRQEGFYVRTLGDEIVRAEDEDTPPQKVVQPVLLDDDGQKLAKGVPPKYKTFQVYDSRAFATMGLL